MPLIPLTALVMLAFAANSLLNRLAVGAGQIDPLSFALIRVLSGAVTLALLVRWQRGQFPTLTGRLLGIAALTTYLIGFSLVYQRLEAGAGALILFGLVQLTMFTGALCQGEPVPPLRWLGAGLAFGGLALLLWPDAGAGVSLTHGLMMALAGMGWGAYSLAGRGQTDALGATAANFAGSVPLVAGIWLAVTGLGTSGAFAQPFRIVLAVVAGAVTSGLGYALWYRILPRLGSGRAASAQLTVPLLASLGGVALLGEPVGWRFGLASLLVLGGVTLAMRNGRALGVLSQK